MIDVSSIITGVVTFVAGGGLVTLYTMRQTREGKQLDNAAQLVKEYKDLLEGYKEENKSLKSEMGTLRETVNNMDLRQTRLERKILNTQSQLEYAQVYRCDKIGCKKRTPPLDIEKLKKLSCLEEIPEDGNSKQQ